MKIFLFWKEKKEEKKRVNLFPSNLNCDFYFQSYA